MKKSFSKNPTRIQDITDEQRMTSLEIAEITGKPHNDVLKAIRKMEPAWEKITQGNFSLSSYKDSTGRVLPCYSLTKTECLYVATKFNDEARAKLVLRWEQLERERMRTREPMSDADILARAVLISQAKIQALTVENQVLNEVNAGLARENSDLNEENGVLRPKADYCDVVLDSVSCLTTTQIAKELGMTAIGLNRLLCAKGIQYGQSGQYLLYAKYARRGYAVNRTHTFSGLFGEVMTRTQLVWTEQGRRFIHRLMEE